MVDEEWVLERLGPRAIHEPSAEGLGVKPLGVACAELAQWGRPWCSYRTLLGCGERKAAPHKKLSLSLRLGCGRTVPIEDSVGSGYAFRARSEWRQGLWPPVASPWTTLGWGH
jgi:hypothetical protein